MSGKENGKQRKTRKTKEHTFDIVNYEVGDLVFAVVKGYPPWPSIVHEVIAVSATLKKYLVYFYGTHNKATIHPKFMFLFQENKDIVKAGKCTKSLFNAILEAEENPMIFEQLLSRNSVTPDMIPEKRKISTSDVAIPARQTQVKQEAAASVDFCTSALDEEGVCLADFANMDFPPELHEEVAKLHMNYDWNEGEKIMYPRKKIVQHPDAVEALTAAQLTCLRIKEGALADCKSCEDMLRPR